LKQFFEYGLYFFRDIGVAVIVVHGMFRYIRHMQDTTFQASLVWNFHVAAQTKHTNPSARTKAVKRAVGEGQRGIKA